MLLAQSTIFVKVIDREPTTGFDFAAVLLRALGVSGVLFAASVALGLLLGGAFIVYRIWQRRCEPINAIGSDLRVTY
jgi:hypothetical protein